MSFRQTGVLPIRNTHNLTPELEKTYGHADSVRYITGSMIEKPQLLKAAINNLQGKPDNELILVFLRHGEQTYVPPELIPFMCEKLQEVADLTTTTWDVLNEIIPVAPDTQPEKGGI